MKKREVNNKEGGNEITMITVGCGMVWVWLRSPGCRAFGVGFWSFVLLWGENSELGEVAKNDKIDRRIRRRIITAFVSVQAVFYTCHPTTISSYNGLFYLPTLTHTCRSLPFLHPSVRTHFPLFFLPLLLILPTPTYFSLLYLLINS